MLVPPVLRHPQSASELPEHPATDPDYAAFNGRARAFRKVPDGRFHIQYRHLQSAITRLSNGRGQQGKSRLAALWRSVLVVPPLQWSYSRTQHDLKPSARSRLAGVPIYPVETIGLQWIGLAGAVWASHHHHHLSRLHADLDQALHAERKQDDTPLRELGASIVARIGSHDWPTVVGQTWKESVEGPPNLGTQRI